MNLSVLLDGSEHIIYNNPRLPLYVRRGDLRSISNMRALCHWHDDVELLLPYKGYLSYNVNGITVHIPQGHAILVNSRQMHYGFSTDGTDCEYVCLTFRPQGLFGSEELVNKYVLPILTASQVPYLLLQPDSQDGMLQAVRRIDALYQEKPEGYELLAVSGLLSFWQGLFVLMNRQIEASAAGDPNIGIVKQMLEYIRTGYSEKITLNAIAGAGGVCRTRCCQIFRQYLGRTPNDYLNSFRLEKAMELLRSTQLSVTEIASACGYNSTSYFTEMFTRAKGCSPTSFRKH